jgi:hypothetical protein
MGVILDGRPEPAVNKRPGAKGFKSLELSAAGPAPATPCVDQALAAFKERGYAANAIEGVFKKVFARRSRSI